MFGNYGEASADVHDLVCEAARAMAAQRWRAEGARNQAELYSFLASRCYRRVGLRTVQAFARHRLDRKYFVGVPRSVMMAGPPRRAAQYARAQGSDHGFYGYQAWPALAS